MKGEGHEAWIYLMNFLHSSIGLCWQTQGFGMSIDDDQDWCLTVPPDQFVDENIILIQLRTRMVPSNNLLTCYKMTSESYDIFRLGVRGSAECYVLAERKFRPNCLPLTFLNMLYIISK